MTREQTEQATKDQFTPTQLQQRIQALNTVFDVVRVVDPSTQR